MEIAGVLSVESVTYHDGSAQWKMLFTAADAPTILAALTAVAHSLGVIALATLDEFAHTLAQPIAASNVVEQPRDRDPNPVAAL